MRNFFQNKLFIIVQKFILSVRYNKIRYIGKFDYDLKIMSQINKF